ncbi:hypothetical protein A3D07_01655 [Candidatus Curtissbacteria bacterium RIFCSPHIGHO2_02_FULL_42_15]|uniref:Uncharacterized protein n=1 Tax=Candidatus Curtissbacteria bacterium RIFCSPHIGHO2_02_FULL_42_15 TaxID=1797716 RepID=A0A1F5GFK0_9BACT|nr:MAG: hypothetical protein A3D07_01655 [Candidatus Curtissbacteria bacterium RIFCSPHIGHO2_02_FULL_42_15]
MREHDLPHSAEPIRGEWRVGSWNVRQEELSFGVVFAGKKISKKDRTALETITMLLITACKLEKSDSVTKEGSLSSQLRANEWLNGVFSEND